MHSGADVEAFQAALNRDIGGDASHSHLSHSDAPGYPSIYIIIIPMPSNHFHFHT
jgi:hypothetical protein